MGPFRLVGPGREIEATPASLQWTSKPNGFEFRGDASSRLLLGTINVIFVAPGRTESYPSRVMLVSHYLAEESSSMSKRIKMGTLLVLDFRMRTNLEPYSLMMMLWWLHLELVGTI